MLKQRETQDCEDKNLKDINGIRIQVAVLWIQDPGSYSEPGFDSFSKC